MTIRIVRCTNDDELYCHYNGQSDPQPCFIELDLSNKVLLADYNANIGGAVPVTVYSGIDRRYTIPILTAEAANKTMEQILPLADRIAADSEIEFDGRNNVAVLGDDAKAAEEEIRKHLGLDPGDPDYWHRGANQGFDDSELVSIWSVDSATNGNEVEEYGITAKTTDERLTAIAIEIMDDLIGISNSDVVACHGLYEHLRGLRDELESEQADD